MKEFQEFYEDNKKMVFRFFYYALTSRDLAEEFTQEVFYQAFVSAHQFRGDSKASTWLMQISKNILFQHYRRKKRDSNFPQQINEIDLPPSPVELLELKEEKAQFKIALIQLPSPYKEVIILRIYNELPFKEIAVIYQKTESWARVSYYRGKDLLQKRLKEDKK